MAIVLLSESQGNHSKSLINSVVDLLPAEPKVAYIPSQSDPGQKNYKRYVAGLMGLLGLEEVQHFGLEDDSWQDSFVDEIYENNILFLSGGNMYHFAYWLKQRKFEGIIREFAENRLIIGVSAGAIVLTPRVDIARDPNDIGLTDFEGFSVVDFYFKPHYKNTPEYKERLQEYKAGLPAEEQGKKLYACPDGSALIVTDDAQIHQQDEIWVF